MAFNVKLRTICTKLVLSRKCMMIEVDCGTPCDEPFLTRHFQREIKKPAQARRQVACPALRNGYLGVDFYMQTL